MVKWELALKVQNFGKITLANQQKKGIEEINPLTYQAHAVNNRAEDMGEGDVAASTGMYKNDFGSKKGIDGYAQNEKDKGMKENGNWKGNGNYINFYLAKAKGFGAIMKLANIQKVFQAVIDAKLEITDPHNKNAWKSNLSNISIHKAKDPSEPAIFIPYYGSKSGTSQIYHNDGNRKKG